MKSVEYHRGSHHGFGAAQEMLAKYGQAHVVNGAEQLEANLRKRSEHHTDFDRGYAHAYRAVADSGKVAPGPAMPCTCDGHCSIHQAKPYSYERAKSLLASALSDLRILAGDEMGPSGACWQDVAGTCAVNLRLLARALDVARMGNKNGTGPIVFPSPTECLNDD